MRKSLIILALNMVLAAVVLNAAEISKEEFNRLRDVEKTLRSQISEMETQLKPSASLKNYTKEYQAAVPKASPQPLTDAEMAKILAGARYVLLGDEHTTARSQANTVLVLNMMRAAKEPLTLVIEWVDISFQKEIDAFLAGKLTLDALQGKISFAKLWGFSWKDYARILAAAKRLKVQVLLTERLKSTHSLADRDTFITTTIAAHSKTCPGMRYLVVYGDYHILGAGHLADKMAKAGFKPQLRLIGDAGEVYWKLLGKVKDPEKIGFAGLGSDIYYILNGTPAERSLSYRNYLMKLLGYGKDDFEELLGPADIKPRQDVSRSFDSLHRD
ncbi:MAG TPA: ChaN family lipoprotein [Candidatus Rifleibacterium sp.]|nr:ChaN family lipoprotein [Candidatus Rifleibacterium sp.]HPT47750.1 ChaN family lipoprotein [Candidatus Rifleibacterium sp.]